jgi:outer membrane protein OmpA-like peptidoglycan-associated protein
MCALSDFQVNKYPTKTVSVEGHTDSMGSEEYNVTLSQNRAVSVRSAIMARGISSDRITAKGLGELYPVASNDTSAGRQQNRRVEILIQSVE